MVHPLVCIADMQIWAKLCTGSDESPWLSLLHFRNLALARHLCRNASCTEPRQKWQLWIRADWLRIGSLPRSRFLQHYLPQSQARSQLNQLWTVFSNQVKAKKKQDKCELQISSKMSFASWLWAIQQSKCLNLCVRHNHTQSKDQNLENI